MRTLDITEPVYGDSFRGFVALDSCQCMQVKRQKIMGVEPK